MTIFNELEIALLQDEPIESIRSVVTNLYASGMEKSEILKEFYRFDEILKKLNRNVDSDYLEDVIDMITGYYVGRNFD